MDFKFGTQLRSAKAYNKTKRKSGRGLELEKISNIWGSLLIFLQRLNNPLSVSRASCLHLLNLRIT